MPNKMGTTIWESYKQMFVYADKKISPSSYLVISLISSLLSSLLIAYFLGFLKFPFIITAAVVFVFANIIFYYSLSLAAEKRARMIETIMPDFLQLLSSNLKAGMTMDKAMMDAARPEFGDFSHLIKRVGKNISFGRDLGDSLMAVASEVKSDTLQRTMKLIKESLIAGGETVVLLEQIASAIKNEQLAQEKVKNSVLAYILFITIAVAGGAPILFGLSSFLVEYMQTLFKGVSIPQTSAMGLPTIGISQLKFSPDTVMIFVILFLLLNAIIGSMVIGELRKGKAVYGLRYMPMLLIVSFAVFFLVRLIIKGLTAGIF